MAAATKLAFVTPTSVMSCAVPLDHGVAPTCVMSFESAVKVPQSLAANQGIMRDLSQR